MMCGEMYPIAICSLYLAIFPFLYKRKLWSPVLLLQFIYSVLFLMYEILWTAQSYWGNYEMASINFWVFLECVPFLIFLIGGLYEHNRG
jgi:hypothetical protein